MLIKSFWFNKTGDFVDYLLRDIKSGCVLDIGCGPGEHTAKIAENKDIRVWGLDLNTSKISEDIKKLPNVRFSKSNALNIPFKPSVFDAVYSNHVLEHIYFPLLALCEWNRVLRKGGYLYLAVPPFVDFVSPDHIFTGWNIGQLFYLLGMTGFDVAEGRFKKESHSIRCIVRKKTAITKDTLGSIKFKHIFANYTKKGSVVSHNIRRYAGNIDKLNWR